MQDAPLPHRPARTALRRRGLVGSPARRRCAQLGLLFVAAALVVNGLIGERGLFEAVRVKREHDRLAGSMSRLKRENQRLADEIRRLKEDPKTIEEVARQDLGLIRPGELVFVIKDVPRSEQNASQAKATQAR